MTFSIRTLRLSGFLALALLVLAPAAIAQAPATFSHQGLLQDDEGTPLEGNFVLEFRLYDTPTGGTALWSELQGLDVVDGLFHATLGLTESLSGLSFDESYWLGIAINSGEELEPRLPLSAVPYSMQAQFSAQAAEAEAVTDGALVPADFDPSAGTDGQVLTIEGGQVSWQEAASGGVPGLTSTPRNDDYLVFVNRDTRIGAEWFGVRAPVAAENQYGGMYIETNGDDIDNSKPFYGYAHNGQATGWHEIDGLSNEWRLILSNNTRFKVEGNTGDVFADGTFNGGGADLAEAFDVEGLAATYAAGDVLVISTTADRTLALSAEPYSPLVAGVYATQPGVLLSERGIRGIGAEQVPVGVVGVVPTKVTGEGGPIRRGDLLVTSSTPGHAMKADRQRVHFGMVLGRALEAFDGTGSGRIQVLVNVK